MQQTEINNFQNAVKESYSNEFNLEEKVDCCGSCYGWLHVYDVFLGYHPEYELFFENYVDYMIELDEIIDTEFLASVCGPLEEALDAYFDGAEVLPHGYSREELEKIIEKN